MPKMLYYSYQAGDIDDIIYNPDKSAENHQDIDVIHRHADFTHQDTNFTHWDADCTLLLILALKGQVVHQIFLVDVSVEAKVAFVWPRLFLCLGKILL